MKAVENPSRWYAGTWTGLGLHSSNQTGFDHSGMSANLMGALWEAFGDVNRRP